MTVAGGVSIPDAERVLSDECTSVTSKAKKRARKRAYVASKPRAATPSRARPVVVPTRREPPSRRSRLARARSPRRLYAYAVALALLAGSLLIGLSLISAHRNTSAAGPDGDAVAVAGMAETAALLEGIPQDGDRLGSPSAPIQLVEYADPQCPYCARYARDVLPALIREYVRPGRVQLVFRGLWFLGPDSGTALRTAAAAASENRLWNVLELLYRNQGPENAWVTEDLLRAIVTGAGADANRVIADREGPAVATVIDQWGRLAQTGGVNAVPAFFVGPRGGPFERLQPTTLAVNEFRQALDGALGR